MSQAVYQGVAQADLIEVWLFIAEDNLTAADAYIDHLQQSCALLAANPLMGIDRSDIAPGVYSFVVENHVIYYELHDQGIAVLRVWHSARDPESLKV